MFHAKSILVLFFALLLTLATGHAQTTFTWPLAPAWPGNAPTTGNSTTVDYFAGGTGFGVAVTVLNSGAVLNTGYERVQTESAATFTGGTTSTTIGTLQLYNTSAASTASFTRVTIKFNYVGGVTATSFTLWDVDAVPGQFIDVIKNISATTTTGTTIYPTLTAGATNAVTGTGASQVVTGNGNATNNTNQGNVGIAFTGAITSLTFEWSNADAAVGAQGIGLSPITFTTSGAAFPEVGSATGALALCGGLLGSRRFRRRKSAVV